MSKIYCKNFNLSGCKKREKCKKFNFKASKQKAFKLMNRMSKKR